tara:strand:- start:195 stop:476 length:282 start_codon:yes stop_codon:yes gene_type:complete
LNKKLFINEISSDLFKVKIVDKSETFHLVTLSDNYLNKLTENKISKKKLIELSFKFLLEKEENTSILSEFDLQVISQYFPDYLDNVKSWCLSN